MYSFTWITCLLYLIQIPQFASLRVGHDLVLFKRIWACFHASSVDPDSGGTALRHREPVWFLRYHGCSLLNSGMFIILYWIIIKILNNYILLFLDVQGTHGHGKVMENDLVMEKSWKSHGKLLVMEKSWNSVGHGKSHGQPKFGQIYFVAFCRSYCFERVFTFCNKYFWSHFNFLGHSFANIYNGESMSSDVSWWLLQHFSYILLWSNVWNSNWKRHIKSWNSHGISNGISLRHICGNPVGSSGHPLNWLPVSLKLWIICIRAKDCHRLNHQ